MTHLTRRSFLASAAAAAALAPFGFAHAGGEPKKRFVFFVRGNGFDASQLMSDDVKAYIQSQSGDTVPDEWWLGRHENAELQIIENGLTGAVGLAPLENRGLLPKSAMVFGLSSMITGGGHTTYHGVLSSERTITGVPGGETIDSYLSGLPGVRGASDRSPLAAIRIGIREGLDHSTCAAGKGQPLPIVGSPAAAWTAYVQPFVDPLGLAALEKRTRYLNLAAADVERALQRRPNARQLLDYQTSIRSLLADQDRFAARIEEMAGRLSAPPAVPSSLDGDPLATLRYQTGVLGSAMEAGLSNVGVVKIRDLGSVFQLGPATESTESHALCHEFNDDNETNIRTELRQVWRNDVEAIAQLAAFLDGITDVGGQGSMLDNTVLVYIPDNGVGHHAYAREFPTLLVGGGTMGLNTGNRALLYPVHSSNAAGRRELSNLWVTLAHLAGDPIAGFGNPARLAPGPLPELLG